MMEMMFLLSVDRAAVERAQRLESALLMLKRGLRRADVAHEIVRRYGCSQPTARRTVAMALDMVR